MEINKWFKYEGVVCRHRRGESVLWRVHYRGNTAKTRYKLVPHGVSLDLSQYIPIEFMFLGDPNIDASYSDDLTEYPFEWVTWRSDMLPPTETCLRVWRLSGVSDTELKYHLQYPGWAVPDIVGYRCIAYATIPDYVSELRPCPVCGLIPELSKRGNHWMIRCCDSQFEREYSNGYTHVECTGKTKEIVVERWRRITGGGK